MRPHDRTISLANGRKLGYAEFGNPHGRPVFYFHGSLSCRLDIAFASAQCSELGVRLIAPDRPGMGISDPKPGRCLLDWSDDVASLADALGIEKFGIIGWSGGGPHAYACAHKFPERLTGVATVGGAAPIIPPVKIADLPHWTDRFFMRTSILAPWLGSLVLTIASKGTPAQFKNHLLRDVHSNADRTVIRSMDLAESSEFFFDSVRNGVRWVLDDYRVITQRWGFELSDIAVPITLFYGVEDPFVPRSHAEYMAVNTPDSKLIVCEKRGHFLLHTDLAPVLKAALSEA